MPIRRIAIVACLMPFVALAVLPRQAVAESPEWRSYPLGQRLNVGVSAFRPQLSTKITVFNPSSVIQGEIDFERDLSLKDTENTPVVFIDWRISRRNKLKFDYFKLDRSGFGPSGVTITIRPDDGSPPVSFPINTPLQSFFDIEVYNFGYEFAPVFNEKWDWSLGLGLSWQDIAVGIQAPNQPALRATADVEAPLLTFSTSLSYAVSEKWLLDLSLGWLDVAFDLDDSGKFEGSILSGSAGVRWQTWKHVGFQAGYQVFDLKADAEESDISGRLEYDYKGPYVGINAYF